MAISSRLTSDLLCLDKTMYIFTTSTIIKSTSTCHFSEYTKLKKKNLNQSTSLKISKNKLFFPYTDLCIGL